MQLKVNPVLAVLLSSFTGFGIAISANSMLVEYLRWRSRRNQQLAQTVDDGQRQEPESNAVNENNGDRQQAQHRESGDNIV